MNNNLKFNANDDAINFLLLHLFRNNFFKYLNDCLFNIENITLLDI